MKQFNQLTAQKWMIGHENMAVKKEALPFFWGEEDIKWQIHRFGMRRTWTV